MTLYLTDRPALTSQVNAACWTTSRTFREQHGYCVTVREIMAEFGIRSPHGVTCHLTALRKKGYLTWEPHQSRTLRPVEAVDGEQQ
jgi:repressor LexA